MKTAEQCVSILKEAFQRVFGRPGSYGEIAYAAGVAQLETNCGDGWGNDSHNWGAVTGTYLGQSFDHKDSRPDGKGGTIWYTTKFRRYPTDLDGAVDFLKVLYTETHNNIPRENVRKAADEVRFRDASAVLRESGYYSGVANVNDAEGNHDEAASIEARITAHAKLVVAALRPPKGRFSSLANEFFGALPKAQPARPALGCLWRQGLQGCSGG